MTENKPADVKFKTWWLILTAELIICLLTVILMAQNAILYTQCIPDNSKPLNISIGTEEVIAPYHFAVLPHFTSCDPEYRRLSASYRAYNEMKGRETRDAWIILAARLRDEADTVECLHRYFSDMYPQRADTADKNRQKKPGAREL